MALINFMLKPVPPTAPPTRAPFPPPRSPRYDVIYTVF